MAERTWPATDITDAQRDALPIDSVVVGTDGSVNAVERVRSVLEAGYPHRWPPQTVSEIRTQNTSKTDAYRQLADVVILTSLVIAGGGLAVSVAGSLAERKRPFSLLRLSGAPLGVLRRVVAFETAAPLLITAVISAGTGLLAAQLFLRAQLNETLQPPSAQYYLLLGLGVAASLAIIASTFPLLARVTGPDTARSE
jgi:predicted lysophospholipase L1 biosynthesis ABC-type transport system permease subunit